MGQRELWSRKVHRQCLPYKDRTDISNMTLEISSSTLHKDHHIINIVYCIIVEIFNHNKLFKLEGVKNLFQFVKSQHSPQQSCTKVILTPPSYHSCLHFWQFNRQFSIFDMILANITFCSCGGFSRRHPTRIPS